MAASLSLAALVAAGLPIVDSHRLDRAPGLKTPPPSAAAPPAGGGVTALVGPISDAAGGVGEAQAGPDAAADGVGEAQAGPLPDAVWRKYTSIETCDRAATVECARAAAAAAEVREWVATEKVHGSNFCFETDGAAVEYASRTARLGDGSRFFNAKDVMPRYHGAVVQAFELARRRLRPDLRRLLIYGEYFGGFWPDGRVEPGLKKIQGGVAYSPGHHFYAFDVSLDGEGYVDFEEARELLLEAGFPLVAEPIRRGTLDEVLAVDVETLETGIPPRLGLPMPSSCRIAEGVVLRPVREVAVGDRGGRAIVKKKAQAFWEATSQPAMAQKTAAERGASGLPGADRLVELARGLINENRLRAVISKDPALLDEGQAPRLAGLLCKDVLEDFAKLYSDEEAAEGPKGATMLRKAVFAMARAFVDGSIASIRADVG